MLAVVVGVVVYNTVISRKSSITGNSSVAFSENSTTDNASILSAEEDKNSVPSKKDNNSVPSNENNNSIPSNVPPKKDIRFTKVVNRNERSNEYKLGEEIVRTYPIGGLKTRDLPNCRMQMVKMPAEPVISADGTKLYFVEESNPKEVRVMDVNKNVSVVYVAPDKYPFVASIAVGPDGSTSYTLFDRNLAVTDCVPDFDKVLARVKAVHIVNGKELPDIKDNDAPSNATNEIRYVFNDEYFALELNTNGISFGVQYNIIIRRVSDNSLVGKFLNLIHEDKLSGEVYVTRKIQCGVYECKQLYKFKIRTGTLDFIFGGDGAYIQDITVTNDSIVIKYSDKFDQKTQRPIFDELKTFEYKFSRN